MPTSDNGVENHVSAAFLRENVAFHGNEDEVLAIAAQGPRGAVLVAGTLGGSAARYLDRFLFRSFLCREAVLDE